MNTRNIICAAMALLMSMTAMVSNWRVRAVKEKEMKTITIEMRDAEAFSLIDLSVAGDLEYTQSLNSKSGVTLIVSEDLADKVEATIHHGRLVVAYKRGTKHHFTTNSQLKVIAHSPALSAVSVNGSGDVMLRGPIRTESLTLHINGSGDVEAHDLTSQRVSVNINGSGDVQLAGKAREARYDINGSGDIDCDQLHCLHVNAAINGSGDIDCYASESINANINGSGDVDCIGQPKIQRYDRR